jgi:hypothetical protein
MKMSEENADQGNLDDKTSGAEVVIPDQFKNSDGSVNAEALAKSYADARKGMDAAFAERDNYKKELESQREMSKLSEGIDKLIENTTPKEEQEPSFDDFMAEKAKAYAEAAGVDVDDPSVTVAMKLVSDSVKAVNSWTQADKEAIEAKYEARIEELRGLITSDQSSRVKASPEYLANKAQIEEMVAEGFDEQKAIAYVLKKAANTSDVSTPVPSMSGGAVPPQRVEDDYWSSPEEREEMVRLKGEERVIAMETAGRARIQATGGK